MRFSSKELTAKALNVNAVINQQEKYSESEVVAFICEFWPVIGPIAQLLKLITNDKADRLIDNISAIMDDIIGKDDVDASKQVELIAQFCELWPIIKTPLKWIKLFTNSKVDRVIDEFLKLGEAICD